MIEIVEYILKLFSVVKRISFLPIVGMVFFTNCSSRYMNTIKVCDRNLYVENYSNWSDKATCYLTDSLNFRVYVGRFDAALDYCSYKCENDSVFIYRKKRSKGSDSSEIKETWRLCLTDIAKKKRK